MLVTWVGVFYDQVFMNDARFTKFVGGTIGGLIFAYTSDVAL